MTWTEILELLSAIGGNVVSLLSGILGLGFTVVTLLYPKLPAARWFFGFGIFALVLSPCLAWRDQYRLAKSQAEQIQELKLRVESKDHEIRKLLHSGTRKKESREALTALIKEGNLLAYDSSKLPHDQLPLSEAKDWYRRVLQFIRRNLIRRTSTGSRGISVSKKTLIQYSTRTAGRNTTLKVRGEIFPQQIRF